MQQRQQRVGLFLLSLTVMFSASGHAQENWIWKNPVPTGMDLNAVVFPASTELGVAVGDGGTILRTVDGGDSWTPQGAVDAAIDLNAVAFASNSIGFAVGSDGIILRATGNGTSWESLPPASGHDLHGVHVVGTNLAVAVGYAFNESVILRTTNGGNSWSYHGMPQTRLLAVHVVDAFIAYAAGHDGAFYKTVDGGVSWFELYSGTTETLRALTFIDPDVGYAVGDNGTVRKTTNGGLSWSGQNTGTTRDLTGVRFTSATDGWVSGENGLVLRTQNGGATWTHVHDEGADLLALHARGQTVWAVGAAGRTVRSNNNGAVWTTHDERATLETVNALHFPSSTIGYAAGEDGTLLKTTDGGDAWTALDGGTDADLNAVRFVDDNTGFAAGASGTLLKTTNGGATWNPRNANTGNTINVLHFVDAQTGWLAGSGGTVRRTTDGGETWEAPASMPGPSRNLTAISFASPLVGWVGGQDALRKTTNGGVTWTSQSTSNPGLSQNTNALYGLHAFDENNVLLMRANGFHRTTNGGSNWFSAGSGYSQLRSLAIHPASGAGIVTTGNGEVIVSNDSGSSWNYRQLLPRDHDLNAVAFTPGGIAFVAGSNAALLKRMPALPANVRYASNSLVFARGAPTPPALPTYTGIVSHFTITPSLPAGLQFNSTTGEISGIPALGYTVSTHTVSAHNESGSTSVQIQISVQNLISRIRYPVRDLALARGQAMTVITPVVEGTPPLGPVTFTVFPPLPGGLSLNAATGALSGTPANAQAYAFYIVTASNGIATFERRDTLRIMVQTPPSDLSYPFTDVVYAVGQPIAPNVPSVTVVTGSSLRYSVVPALPPGLSLDSITGTISGTPTRTTNAATYTITAKSASGNATATVRIAVPGPPAALNYPTVTLGVNVQANGVGNPGVHGTVTHWSIAPPLPEGLWLDSSTGRFHGSTPEALAGAPFTVTARNDSGSVSATVTLNVLNPIVLFNYPTRTFELRADEAMVAVSPIVAGTLPFTPVTYVVTPPLPDGLTLNTSSGAVHGTPTNAGVQPATQHVITARNGVAAFNKTDTLTITVRRSITSIRTARAELADGLRFGGTRLSLHVPQQARVAEVTLRDLHGRIVATRVLNLQAHGHDLSTGVRSGAGVLVLRVRFRDADGAELGGATTRVTALP